MRPVARMALAAATTLAVTLPIAGAAKRGLRTRPAPSPSQAQVTAPRPTVDDKQQSVAQIEAGLAAANAADGGGLDRRRGRLRALPTARCGSWTTPARQSRAGPGCGPGRPRPTSPSQRDGIIPLVTESYQNGTELNTATALMLRRGSRPA